MLFRFEHKTAPLAHPAVFAGRVTANIIAASVLIAAALTAGMFGYRATEHMSWTDAFLNAAMLLGGMGPVTPLESEGGKLFAGFYALACGLLIVITTGVVLAPVLHRILHSLHVQDGEN